MKPSVVCAGSDVIMSHGEFIVRVYVNDREVAVEVLKEIGDEEIEPVAEMTLEYNHADASANHVPRRIEHQPASQG